jgi:hypothetical protein
MLVEMRNDLIARRLRLPRRQPLKRNDDSVDAVAALTGLKIEEQAQDRSGLVPAAGPSTVTIVLPAAA